MWAKVFDSTYDATDPHATGFPDQASEVEFYEHGLALARELAQAVPGASVCFFDDRRGAARHVWLTHTNDTISVRR